MRKDSRSDGKLMGVNKIGSRRVEAESLRNRGRIDIKSKATFTKRRSYIGNGDG